MGFRIKLLSILGFEDKKKMKEKKAESFSFFRKTSSRYAFSPDKKKPDPTTVQVQRLSWSSFPLSKLPDPEDVNKGNSLPTRRSRSSENLKRQNKNFYNLSKSKSSSFFKASTSTVKSIFSFGSSSPFAASSSCSSASSSPKVRQSWSSNVMHILERCEDNDDAYDDEECMEYKSIEGSLCPSDESLYKKKKSHFLGHYGSKFFPSITRNNFPDTSVLEENEDEEVMCTPKIICAHEKTPDVVRKTRKQILQELEYIRTLGTLPEEIESKESKNRVQGKENRSPNYENYPFVGGNLSLSSLRGYKPTTSTNSMKISHSDSHLKGFSDAGSINNSLSDNSFLSSQQDEIRDSRSLQNQSIHNSSISKNSCDISSDKTETFSSEPVKIVSKTKLNRSSSMRDTKYWNNTSSSSSTSDTIKINRPSISSSRDKNLNIPVISVSIEDDSHHCNSGILPYNSQITLRPRSRASNISTEDDSGDDSEAMSSNEAGSTFEERLENHLENLVEVRNFKDSENDANALSDEEDKVLLRRRPRPNLHIDIDKVKSKQFPNERLLRRIGEDCDSVRSSRSSKSSPRTPRSPAIDIDDIFKQKQKQIEESEVDTLTQVKDLTQRLRLETKNIPSHVEWLNGLSNKKDARHLAEAMSPAVLENPEGVFLLRDIDGQPTEEQRTKNVTKALVWIKEELIKLKEQDQVLARQLVHLQLEMQRLRLHRSCTQHEALLEEVTCEEEEQKAYMTSTDLIDLPNNLREFSYFPLRDFGVTRLNLSNRRFTLR